MSCAKTGDFPSANEPVFAPAAGAMARGKIGIVVNILVSPSGSVSDIASLASVVMLNLRDRGTGTLSRRLR